MSEVNIEVVDQAMKKVSALGEYLLLDDIRDFGKLDHFHHYIVGLLLFFLGVSGEMAGKVLGFLSNFKPPSEVFGVQPQPLGIPNELLPAETTLAVPDAD